MRLIRHYSIILDKVGGLFMRICETINDILPPTDSGEEVEYVLLH